jgi:hypothetical protein
VANLEQAYSLARPPQDISADSLIAFGQGMLHDRHGRRKSAAVERLRQSQRDLAANTSLAGLGRLSPG